MARDQYAELRLRLDSQDPFMIAGHQILKSRRYMHKRPAWVKEDKQVRDLLLAAFPNLTTNPTQRTRAARWMRVIHLYFGLGWTYSQVAEEMGLKFKTIRNVLQAVYYVSSGLTAKGDPRKRVKSN